jgi:acyl-coenzyme A synthetase/AMP-(fatty) acid ligase
MVRRGVTAVEEMPLNTNGKIDRRAVTEMLAPQPRAGVSR